MYLNSPRRIVPRTYRLYGLSVKSQWALPCPESPDACPAAVELVEASASFFVEAAQEAARSANGTEWFHQARLRDGSIYLRWSALFEFLVSTDGSHISGRPITDGSPETFHTYLLGQVLSFSLLKRGLDPLHATAAVVDGGAVGFLGDNGYGKSSLGAAFLQEGYPLLTDDLLVVKEEDDGLSAYPGVPRIKLFPEIARNLLGAHATGTPMNLLTRKLIIPLDRSQFHQAAVPLQALYVLTPPTARARSHRVTIRHLSRRRSFLELVRSNFNPFIIDSQRLKCQFELDTRIASTVPIRLLSYPRTVASVPFARDAILSDLRR